MVNDLSHRPPKVVVVVGSTGVGKSTLIRDATGRDVKIGKDLEACTDKVAVYAIPGENTVIVDTPGFDDTFRGDSEILQEVNQYLSAAYREQWDIAGVLYLHPITETKMKGSTMKQLRIFREMFGMDKMANCTLVTTKWSLQDMAVSEWNETQLAQKPHFWKPLLDCGAKMERYADTKESALELVHQLTRKAPVVPAITHQTENLKMRLVDTDAGRVVDEDLQDLTEKHKEDLKQLAVQIAAEKDEAWADVLRVERKQVQDGLERAEVQQEVLRRTPMLVKAMKYYVAGLGSGMLFVGSTVAFVATAGFATESISSVFEAGVDGMFEWAERD